MSGVIPDWPRPRWEPGGGNAMLHYVVFGPVREPLNMVGGEYRSAGLPSGIEVCGFERDGHGGVFNLAATGLFGSILEQQTPETARLVQRANSCIVIHGEVEDPPDLNYLRDVVGLITCMLDSGGVAALDMLAFKWWSPETWRSRIFDPAGPMPRHHVSIFVSEDASRRRRPDTEWIHTRGMRKFGRPDLGIHNVLPAEKQAVIDLCSRFIVHLAFGMTVQQGAPIQSPGIPFGTVCHLAGGPGDPDYDNVHFEVCLDT